DDQDPHDSGDQRLRPVEADYEPQAAFAEDRPETGERLTPDAFDLGTWVTLAVGADPAEHEGRPQEQRGGRREDGPDAGDSEQQPAQRGDEEEADALERGRGRVRCGQLLRR